MKTEPRGRDEKKEASKSQLHLRSESERARITKFYRQNAPDREGTAKPIKREKRRSQEALQRRIAVPHLYNDGALRSRREECRAITAGGPPQLLVLRMT